MPKKKKRNIKKDCLTNLYKLVLKESSGEGEFDYESPDDVFDLMLNYLKSEIKKCDV